MATEPYIGRRRSGWLAFFLGLITLTVWWKIWIFQANSDLRKRGIKRGNPVLHTILAIFPLLALIAYWRTAAGLRTLQASTGVSRDAKPTLLMVLPYILPIIGHAIYIVYSQNSLNEVWDAMEHRAHEKAHEVDLACPSCQTEFVIRKKPFRDEFVACPTCGYEGDVV